MHEKFMVVFEHLLLPFSVQYDIQNSVQPRSNLLRHYVLTVGIFNPDHIRISIITYYP